MLDELKQLIHTSFGIDPATIDADAPLSEYGLDSLALAELLFTIEEHFDIDLSSLPSNVSTLSGLAQVIEKIQAGGTP